MDAQSEFDIHVFAYSPTHVAVMGQGMAAVERTVDGCTTTILMNCGKEYPFTFRTKEEAEVFHAKVVAFLRNWQSIHDVLNIIVSEPPPGDAVESGSSSTAGQSNQTTSRLIL